MHEWDWGGGSEFKVGELELFTSEHTPACYLMEPFTWKCKDKAGEDYVPVCTDRKGRIVCEGETKRSLKFSFW